MSYKAVSQYFVKEGEDTGTLVVGYLHRGYRPKKNTGTYFNIKSMSLKLHHRYWAKRNHDGSLVPGSLIMGEEYPDKKQNWLEIVKNA